MISMTWRSALLVIGIAVSGGASAEGPPADAPRLAWGDAVRVDLQAGEKTWFRIDPVQGGHLLARVVLLDGKALSVRAVSAGDERLGGDAFRVTDEPVFVELEPRYRESGMSRFRLEKAADLDFFEPNDAVSTATPLLLGLPLAGQLFPAGDRDVYRVTAPARGYLTPSLRWQSRGGKAVTWHLLDAEGREVARLDRAGESFPVEAGEHWLRAEYRYRELSTDSYVVGVSFARRLAPQQMEVIPGATVRWRPAAAAPRTYRLNIEQPGWFFVDALAQPFASTVSLDGKPLKGATWIEPGHFDLSFEGRYQQRSVDVATHRLHVVPAGARAEPGSWSQGTTVEVAVAAERPAQIDVVGDGDQSWFLETGRVRAPFHGYPEPDAENLTFEVRGSRDGRWRELHPREVVEESGEHQVRVSLQSPNRKRQPVLVEVTIRAVPEAPAGPQAGLTIGLIALGTDGDGLLRGTAGAGGAAFVSAARAGSLDRAVIALPELEARPARGREGWTWLGVLVAGIVVACLVVARRAARVKASR